MTCSTRLVNKWRRKIRFCAPTDCLLLPIIKYFFILLQYQYQHRKNVSNFTQHFVKVNTHSSPFWNDLVAQRWKRRKTNQSTHASPDIRFDGAFVLGREHARIYTQQWNTHHKNVRGKMEAADFAFSSSNQFSYKEETLSPRSQSGYYTWTHSQNAAAMNEWLSRTRALAHKKTPNWVRTNTNHHQHHRSSKAWRYYFIQPRILAILLHSADTHFLDSAQRPLARLTSYNLINWYTSSLHFFCE